MTIHFCRACGVNATGNEICDRCGCHPFNGNNYCSNCGFSTLPQAVMCPNCKNHLPAPGIAPYVDTYEDLGVNRSSRLTRRSILRFLTGSISIVLVFFVLYYLFSRTDLKTSVERRINKLTQVVDIDNRSPFDITWDDYDDQETRCNELLNLQDDLNELAQNSPTDYSLQKSIVNSSLSSAKTLLKTYELILKDRGIPRTERSESVENNNSNKDEGLFKNVKVQ